MSEPIKVGDHLKLARRWIKLGSGYSNVENYKFVPAGTKTLPPAMNGEAEDRYVVVVETNDKKTVLKPTDPRRKITINVDTSDLSAEGSTTIPIADYFGPRAAKKVAPSDEQPTQSTFERCISSNNAVATALKIVAAPALAFSTVMAASGVDALLNYQDREAACTDKMTQLTSDFYERAPAGETPALNNVYLDENETATYLSSFVKPKKCYPATGSDRVRSIGFSID